MATYKIRKVGKYKYSLPRGRKTGLYNIYRNGKVVATNVPSKNMAKNVVGAKKFGDKIDLDIRKLNIKSMKNAYNTMNDLTKPITVRKNAKKRYNRLKKELRV